MAERVPAPKANPVSFHSLFPEPSPVYSATEGIKKGWGLESQSALTLRKWETGQGGRVTHSKAQPLRLQETGHCPHPSPPAAPILISFHRAHRAPQERRKGPSYSWQ